MNKISVFRIIFLCGGLLLSCPAMFAQHTASELLEWTRQHLDNGDCEKARATYELYKDKVPAGDAEVERRIDECGREPLRFISEGYVDLGLPSGTLWKSTNEGGKNESGFYDYDEAVKKFGSYLPTKEQWMELSDLCSWTWTGHECKVVGPNGNFILLPGNAFRTCEGLGFVGNFGRYWSSAPCGSEHAWDLCFGTSNVKMDSIERCLRISVRLVDNLKKNNSSAGDANKEQSQREPQMVIHEGYVDLELPSGTLWKSKNEPFTGFAYTEAMDSFPGQIPTKEQWEELIKYCDWEWKDDKTYFEYVDGEGHSFDTDKGSWYIVTSKINKRSIEIYAEGYMTDGLCVGCGGIGGVGGYYYSSTPQGDSLWCFFFNSRGYDCGKWEHVIDYAYKMGVHLVKNLKP